MIYIGIDPGQSGGIAVTYWGAENGVAVSGGMALHSMPKTEADIWSVFEEFRSETGRHPDLPDRSMARAVIEKVHSFPGQGVASSFKFGRNYGFLRGCLVAAGIPFEEITPHKWQKALGIPKRGKTESKTEFKNRLKQKAQQLYPGIKITLATADALLIARYARIFWEVRG